MNGPIILIGEPADLVDRETILLGKLLNETISKPLPEKGMSVFEKGAPCHPGVNWHEACTYKGCVCPCHKGEEKCEHEYMKGRPNCIRCLTPEEKYVGCKVCRHFKDWPCECICHSTPKPKVPPNIVINTKEADITEIQITLNSALDYLRSLDR